MNILHITSILPAPTKNKLRENDILLRLAQEYEKKYPEDEHFFVFIIPYSNPLFALFKKKWREYYLLIKRKHLYHNNTKVLVLGVPGFKNDSFIKKYLVWFGYLYFNKRIKEFLTNVMPDIVHAHNLKSNLELAEIIKKKTKVNYVVSVRAFNYRVIKRIKNKKVTPSAILSISNMSAIKTRGLFELPLHIIPHPVDYSFFVNEIIDDNVYSKTVKLVTVGKLITLKNINVVIKALKNIDLNFSYTIYGDGPEKERLWNLAKSLNIEDKINFSGFVSHSTLSKKIKDYDLLILISFPEALGRVYFEAMASGVPVIASKNTGIDGMINHKEHGYLVDHKNVRELENAILHFVSMPYEEKMLMKRKVIDHAKHFTWENTLEKYFYLYHNSVLE